MPTASKFLAAHGSGALDLPLPGHGRTADRFAALAGLARTDTVLGRLAEGHTDAVAILAELDGPDPADAVWGVWAAVPNSIVAVREEGTWWLAGDRPWCSGAGVCTRALVTATTDDGVRLFAVDVTEPAVTALDGTWPAVGMAGSDSRTVRFTRARGIPVGGVGDYVNRPGFWAGGAGVAACWYGAAVGVAERLVSSAPTDPHALAHLGAVDTALGGASALLDQVSALIDTEFDAAALRRPVRRVRAAVEAAATATLDHVGRALGAGPLCQDAEHARRTADLTVYLRQSHAERDLADLGTDVLLTGAGW
ncbi:acyl-CoA/acyl-ACP dehydrogenase [Cryptosporangium arvum]|uniref:acyl-CoA/acyl-ACP dehydrogenase n=1 Tax=Cryptosporangium arvum TaxID=80871 RepID=UPI0004B184EF|nr:acyl-CoA/acyl-ACP dehydrogenase [Cryptosporangium arvum]